MIGQGDLRSQKMGGSQKILGCLCVMIWKAIEWGHLLCCMFLCFKNQEWEENMRSDALLRNFWFK